MWNLGSLKEMGEKGKGAHELKAKTSAAYPGFLSMKHAQDYCYSTLDGTLVHRRVTPQQRQTGVEILVQRNNAKGEA